MAWNTFFNFYGPLDWEREDIRDARRVMLRFGKKESTVEDCRVFPPPKRETEIDREIRNLKNLHAAAISDGDAESAENCLRQIRWIRMTN